MYSLWKIIYLIFLFPAICLLKKHSRVEAAAMRQEAKGGGQADESCNNQRRPVHWSAPECNDGGHFGGGTEGKEGKLEVC